MFFEAIKYAAKNSVSKAGAWAPLPGALVVWLGLWVMGYEIAAPETLPQGIAAFLLCAAAAWVIIFLGRLFYWPYRELRISRRRLARALSRSLAYLSNRDSELGWAIQQMGRRSAWGRWYSAQNLATSGVPIREESLLNTASGLVMEKIIDGELEVRGRQPGKIEYESIPRTDWRSSALHFLKDPISLWKMIIIPRGGAEITSEGTVIADNAAAAQRNARICNYDSLIVDSCQFENLWPEKDEPADKLRRNFLRAARRRRLDQTEIDRLS
jgi:hypothetical protein